MRKILLIFIVLILLSTTAFATNWKYAANDTYGNKYYIDTDSVISQGYNSKKDEFRFIVTMRVQFSEYGKAKRLSSSRFDYVRNYISYSIENITFRCKNEKRYFRLEGSAFYSDDDEFICSGGHFNSFLKINEKNVHWRIYDVAYDCLY